MGIYAFNLYKSVYIGACKPTNHRRIRELGGITETSKVFGGRVKKSAINSAINYFCFTAVMTAIGLALAFCSTSSHGTGRCTQLPGVSRSACPKTFAAQWHTGTYGGGLARLLKSACTLLTYFCSTFCMSPVNCSSAFLSLSRLSSLTGTSIPFSMPGWDRIAFSQRSMFQNSVQWTFN